MFKNQTLFDNVKLLCDKNTRIKLGIGRHDITHYDREISPSRFPNSAKKSPKQIRKDYQVKEATDIILLLKELEEFDWDLA